MEEIKNIRISELKDFKNHPFHVQQDMELCALMKSIEDEGVIVPLLVGPNPDGEGYEVIAGHRRKAAAQWAGLAEVPAVIREMDDNQAIVAMVDSNLQRENLKPSEKAYACDTMYKYALSRCLTPEEKQNVKKVTKNQLLSWGLLQEQDGKMVPTNGYMLLNQNDLQEASVQCGVFKGTTRATFVDKKEYGGTLCEQIDEAYQFVLRNIRMGAEFGGLYRRDVYELPIDSIRELIANAVSHRSYLDPGKVQVALYDDRLEVTSPGMLIGGLTIEELKNGYSRPRNRGIVSALAYMKVVEQWGSGIPRLFENCKKAGLREPELIEMGGCFRVNMYRNTEIAKESMNTATSSEDTLQNDASNEGGRDKFGINDEIRDKFGINEGVRENYGETAANILCLMLEKPENTLDSIANTLGVTRRTVEKQVKKLKEVGIVSRVGSNKSGSWKVDIKEDR